METQGNITSLPEKELKLHYQLVKMMATMQVVVELMDDFAGTDAYKKDIKFYGKGFLKYAEAHLNMMHKHLLDEESEKTLMSIERAVKTIIETEIEDLYLVGHRED